MIYFHKELPYLHLLILHLFFLKSNSTPQTFTEFSIDKVISNFLLYSSVNAFFFLKYFLFWASTTPSPLFFFYQLVFLLNHILTVEILRIWFLPYYSFLSHYFSVLSLIPKISTFISMVISQQFYFFCTGIFLTIYYNCISHRQLLLGKYLKLLTLFFFLYFFSHFNKWHYSPPEAKNLEVIFYY